MRRTEDEIRKSDAERLLLKAKEMESKIEKIPVRVNPNTVLLISADKLHRRESEMNASNALSKKKTNGRRKL